MKKNDDGINKEAEVWKALKKVIDPELNINIVDLGLIYKIEVGGDDKDDEVEGKDSATLTSGTQVRWAENDGGNEEGVLVFSEKKVMIEMTLTTVGCPLGPWFEAQVKARVAVELKINPEQVEVKIVFDPPWHQGLMNEEAIAELGLD